MQRTDIGINRANAEHAIAVLIGKPPSELTIAPMVITPPVQNVVDDTATTQPGNTPSIPSPSSNNTAAAVGPVLPAIPGILPSALLERRPDIAANERRMAAANEAIGIEQAAYYPTFSLSASGGFLGTSLLNWFSWPSHFFAVGPTISETIFDFGRRKSTKDMTVAQYNATVSDYRQTSLTAFQQVEDNLSRLRNLTIEAEQQHAATAAAERGLELFNDRYEGGVDTYLQVITAQTAALNNERNDILIRQRRLEASILLIKALGGGWSATTIPHL